ncbi:MAG: protein translocase subunit SecF [Endomicrobiales bacterium]|nr:protein translocase subunit SecF [Endomicrobiales bacterium]
MEILKKMNIDFIGQRRLFFIVSVVVILSGAISLLVKGGPNLGIDFKGGILLQLAFEKQMNMDDLRSTLNESDIIGYELQSSDNNSVIIRIKKADFNAEGFARKVVKTLSEKYPDNKVEIERSEYVGPAIGHHLVKQAFFAIIFSLLGIIVYVAFRFHSGLWGIAGVLALAHDVFIVIGIFSIFNKEITLTVIAAILTLAGYSINDTIVIFDRIRENLRMLAKSDLPTVINSSINQTLSRTVITSLTSFLVVLALFLFGGEVIHDFAFALVIGIIVGTYSSIYIASPLVYEWELYRKRREKRR